MSGICGLDFGTSNTAVGFVKNDKVAMHKFGEAAALPSLIFFDLNSGKFFFGREALDKYYRHHGGRIMKSLKSVLGTKMLDDVCWLVMSTGENKLYTYKRIIGFYLKHIKESLENAHGVEYDKVIAGRPVYFIDNDPEADRKAQAELEDILRIQGFNEISFQYEPLAALKTFSNDVIEEQIVLVIDIGGGTADFSLVRIPQRSGTGDNKLNFSDILANDGIHLGGDDIDELASMNHIMPVLGYKTLTKSGLEMPNKQYIDISKLRNLGALYSVRNMDEIKKLLLDAQQPELIENLLNVVSLEEAHLIRFRVEDAKINLSMNDQVAVDLSFIQSDLDKKILRTDFNNTISSIQEKIIDKIKNMVSAAGIKPEKVTSLFFTGGTTKIPVLQNTIREYFKDAVVQEGDTFGAVANGLTIEALQRYS